jgi:glucose-6-phosphate dehydrogenase assembly protein OpcA
VASLATDRILKELSELWVTLGKPGEAEPGAGVLRACSLTLVVLAEESEDVSLLGETLAALMPEHPARAILVRLHGAGPRTLADRVYAQCWMPFGQRRQICCEQIEITASDAALGDIPSVVLPLAVADLPVVVWCRSARLVEMPEFRAVAGMAQKVVLDSGAMPQAMSALRTLADSVGSGPILGDLAWTRLTRWRAMLSQVFQNREYLAKLPSVTDIRLWFGAGLETAAWYMGAWISDVLSEARVKASLAVAPLAEEPSLRVELAGEDFLVRMERQDGKLTVSVNELKNCTNLPQLTDYLLMREELGIMRRDAVYERTLASASRLAGRIT